MENIDDVVIPGGIRVIILQKLISHDRILRLKKHDIKIPRLKKPQHGVSVEF